MDLHIFQIMWVEFGQGATSLQPHFTPSHIAKSLPAFSNLQIWINWLLTNLEKAFMLFMSLLSFSYNYMKIFSNLLLFKFHGSKGSITK